MPDQGKVDAFGLTAKGRARRVNEDQFLVARVGRCMQVEASSLGLETGTRVQGGSLGHVFAVADGLGGNAGGASASSIALEDLVHFLLNERALCFGREGGGDIVIREELVEAMRDCESTVRRYADADPAHRSMATTLTVALVLWPRLHVVHVGDSRCYLCRGGELRRLTRDHTYADALLQESALEPEKAERSLLGQVVWNAIGGSSTKADPEIQSLPLEVGDSLLLCTDGLTGEVEEDRIARLLCRRRSAASTCRDLVEAAEQRGATDDVTAVVVHFRERGDPECAEEAEAAARRDVEAAVPDESEGVRSELAGAGPPPVAPART